VYRNFGKRALDLVLVVPALIVLAPVMAILAVLIRIAMGSPVIFTQERAGKHGKPFMLYKFRSMTNARDAQGNLLPDEQRLTPFGKFLRSTSLDELPQLFNVPARRHEPGGTAPIAGEIHRPVYPGATSSAGSAAGNNVSGSAPRAEQPDVGSNPGTRYLVCRSHQSLDRSAHSARHRARGC
jgi:hypothetical protein